MRFFTAVLLAVAAVAAPVISAPAIVVPASPRDIQKSDGPASGKYIVTLKDGASKDTVLRRAGVNATDSWTIINAFAGKFSPEALEIMRNHPDVKDISEDGIMEAFATQTNAPWGLGRLSSQTKLTGDPGTLAFRYDFQATGRGVNVYILDTGIRTTHQQFGGRARWGANFIPESPNTDDNGHGTHCAGTVAGSLVGVAKEATVVAVKVLNSAGSGSVSGIISGLQWVANDAAGRPSVASMSLGGGANTAMDDAVRAVVARGIHVTVAAGNSNTDASGTSPARVAEAITVAASNILDAKASFSNYGAPVDIWAPGETVISSWNSGDDILAILSGTSMATPHVAGLIAYLIQLRGNLPPAVMSDRLKQLSLQGVVTGVPSGTVNLLANNLRA